MKFNNLNTISSSNMKMFIDPCAEDSGNNLKGFERRSMIEIGQELFKGFNISANITIRVAISI